jgi:hypothetical protein
MTRARWIPGVFALLWATQAVAQTPPDDTSAPEPAQQVASGVVRELYQHPNQGSEAFRFDWDTVSLSLNLMAQAQVSAYVQKDALIDNGDPASAEGFRLRRARVGFYGTYKEKLGISVVVDVKDPESGGTTLSSATLLYQPMEALNLALGTAPLPFSRGAITSSSRLQMIERPMAIQYIVPGSQLGIAALGSVADGLFEYAAGVYNGQSGRYGLGPLTRGYLAAARVQVAPLGRMPRGESDYEQSPLRVAIGGDYYHSDDKSVVANAVSADVSLKWRGLSVLGEFLWDRRSPEGAPVATPTLPARTERMAFYAQAGYFVIPRLLELAARYEWFDDHRSIDDAGDMWLVSGGANLYLFDGYLKAQVNYQHRHERKVPQLDNDVLFLLFQVNL